MASPFNLTTQDVSLAYSEMFNRKLAGANPVLSEEIIHELRQPLGVIDSLAYYLELTAVDERFYAHLEQIRAMAMADDEVEKAVLEKLIFNAAQDAG